MSLQECFKVILCEYLISNGYEIIEEQALNILMETLSIYIKKMGIGIKRISNLQGNSTSNILDVFTYMDIVNINFSDFNEYINSVKIIIQEINQNREANPIINPKSQNNYETIKQSKAVMKEYSDFLPVFPEKFSYKNTEVKPKINFTELQIKEIKCAQKKQTDQDISLMKEIAIDYPNINYEKNQNPFSLATKKVKLINLDEF